jgi:hypothetical protein
MRPKPFFNVAVMGSYAKSALTPLAIVRPKTAKRTLDKASAPNRRTKMTHFSRWLNPVSQLRRKRLKLQRRFLGGGAQGRNRAIQPKTKGFRPLSRSTIVAL